MDSSEVQFISFWEGGGGAGGGGGERILFLFPLVLIMFHMCSHDIPQVLNVFPKTFPIAPHFYPVWQSKEVLLLGSAQCSKKIGDRPINIAPSKKRKESVRAPIKCQ